MATNDFLPFAIGGSANVLTQAQWAALGALLNGFQSGIADSKSINKAFRQSSIMSAVLAQFIVNQTGQNATDDGTTATLIANLLAAVKASSNSVVGSMRNGSMYVSAASATATFAADEIIVESALGGLTYRLASFSKTINLATTGAGGMDTGTAPVSGYVALYAIYNPTTGASALLAVNATSAVAPNVYGGANMPAGYTASALVSVWPTNASSQFVQGVQSDRDIEIQVATGLSNTNPQPSITAVSIAAIVPKNARRIHGSANAFASTSGVAAIITLFSSSVGLGASSIGVPCPAANIAGSSPFTLTLQTPQTVYYTSNVSSGAFTSGFGITGYSI